MPIVVEDVRRLATVETVAELHPIEGADRLERAVIRGWNVVVKKGEFAVGDKVVYFEEDSALPLADPEFSFLAPRGVKADEEGNEYHVLKVARLRGVYSQGLVLPMEPFEDRIYTYAVREGLAVADPDWHAPVGMNVTEALNIRKWEDPMPVGNGQQAGSFPTNYVSKTDAERIQNLTDVWDLLAAQEWVATEKVDGTSLTVLRDHEGELHVCSRNWEIRDGDNTYWNVVRKFNLGDLLAPGEVIQAEIAGPGIQGNRQNVPLVRPYVFNFVRNRQVVPRSEWPEGITALSVPVLDVEFPNSPEDMLALVDGMKSTIDPKRLAEGIVWQTVSGVELPELGNRAIFKVVSARYLTKN